VTADRARIFALEELQALVVALASTHGHTPSIHQVLGTAPTACDRERRRRLLCLLR
jgi:hypothetical protein